jgi:ADP-ribose pyrophosphatase YjhB (NUDIX family)
MKSTEQKLFDLLNDLKQKLPSFPDGRINYKDSDLAPVLTVFISFGAKILLLKRSKKVNTYQGKWNTVAGYIDQIRPLKEKVLEELREELSIDEAIISDIKYGNTHTIVGNPLEVWST